jgi:hypothetical protein
VSAVEYRLLDVGCEQDQAKDTRRVTGAGDSLLGSDLLDVAPNPFNKKLQQPGLFLVVEVVPDRLDGLKSLSLESLELDIHS